MPALNYSLEMLLLNLILFQRLSEVRFYGVGLLSWQTLHFKPPHDP